MKCTVEYNNPDTQFWERYSRLWQNSMHRSPFQSPHILEYYSSRLDGRLAVFQCEEDDKLLGAALFKLNNGIYTFLSDMKTDANFFVLHRDLSAKQTRHFFNCFMQTVTSDKWALMLNNKPAWADYMEIFEEVVRPQAVHWTEFESSICLLATSETPAALFQQISSSRNTRYKVNKLVKQEKGRFEVLTDDSDMDLWVEEFCKAHVLRWANTPTPSAYSDPERLQFLKNCLYAWQKDNLLVRFALKVEQGRIGFVAGLLDGDNTLIYHAPTFHPDFSHCSPGKVLIYFITEWMAANNLSVLDFGDGDEAYKHNVATEGNALKRIFISGVYNPLFNFKARLIKTVRKTPQVYRFYKTVVKPIRRILNEKKKALFDAAPLTFN